MGIVTVPTFGEDPVTVNSANLNALVSGLATEFNGNIDNANISSSAAIANSKLNLTSISQAIAMSSKSLLWAKGADVASATSIALGTDGNCFDITGTTTIQTITAKQAGSVVLLHFDGALTLTDNTGNLELQGADLVVAAEDEVILKSDGTNWHLVATTAGAAKRILTTRGDLLYRNATTPARLAVGTSGYVVKSDGTDPGWGVLAGAILGTSGGNDNTLSVTNPTGARTFTIPDASVNLTGYIEFKVGTYTGDGIDDKEITIGFNNTALTAKYVRVVKDNGTTGGWFIAGMSASQGADGGADSTGIKSLAANKFTLGTNADYNGNGTDYVFFAIGQ